MNQAAIMINPRNFRILQSALLSSLCTAHILYSEENRLQK